MIKKTLALFIVLGMIICLSACGQNPKTEVNEKASRKEIKAGIVDFMNWLSKKTGEEHVYTDNQILDIDIIHRETENAEFDLHGNVITSGKDTIFCNVKVNIDGTEGDGGIKLTLMLNDSDEGWVYEEEADCTLYSEEFVENDERFSE